ncbi:MAG: hypothetical protein VX589_16430 [Myxococcota bacterium]|nr:hypothetical protein [Myxococcota bacterium]
MDAGEQAGRARACDKGDDLTKTMLHVDRAWSSRTQIGGERAPMTYESAGEPDGGLTVQRGGGRVLPGRESTG